MRVSTTKFPDINNGDGVRVSVFVSGCTLNCKGCFNKGAQSFMYGEEADDEFYQSILDKLNHKWVRGLTLLGGDPLEPKNQKDVLKLCRMVKKELPDKDIWCWTGRLLDKDLIEGGKDYTQYTDELLSLLDVVIDGPFIQEQFELGLKWRGSLNQRKMVLQDNKSFKQEPFGD